MAKRVPISTFVAYMIWAYENGCGYIMGSYGQDPQNWAKSAWWFTQYKGSQREKALYWREHAPQVFDCNGIAEGCYQKETGVNINARARNNYAAWCTNKGSGRIPVKLRVPGAAVFIHNGCYISHVGYLWKPVGESRPEGDWWVIEARGVMYGVVKTKLYARGWNRYGWMTKYFDYDAAAEPVVYALGERTLSVGCEGEDARELQTKLLSWGYDLGKWGADGEFGSCTKAAVAKFQQDHMLPATGVYDADTHAALVDFAESESEDGDVETPDPDTPDEDAPAKDAYPVFRVCPDISKYQARIDFDAFCAGADFAIFRARVNGKNDVKFKEWAAECVKRGFPFSVYDFITLTDEADAAAQAEAFYDLTSPFNPRIYYLDVETLGSGIGHDANRRLIQAYVARLRELGAEKIGLYMGSYRFRTQYKQIADIFDTLWLANWGKQTGYLSSIPSDPCDLHQYTSMGYATPKGAKERVPGAPGIQHRIDLNRLTGGKPLSFFTGREHTPNGDTSKGGAGFEYVGLAKTTAANTSVRSGPGSQFSKLGAAAKGSIFERRPGDTEDWYAILYMGKDAFVSKKYCKTMKG
ncbi:MAG: peptidoglycan-binding protein [Clostridia bacterium]